MPVAVLIGVETRELLERRPASAVVVQLIYKKYVRKARAAEEASGEVLSPEAVELPKLAANVFRRVLLSPPS